LPCDLEAASVNTMADLFSVPLNAPSKVAPTGELARQ